MMKLYLARGMTGRPKSEVVKEAKQQASWLRQAGFDVLCPVEVEQIKDERGSILATYNEIKNFWRRDKQMIRDSHVVFHMTPHMRSDGAWHEIGYKRYHLQGPVVHIYPTGQLPPASAVSYLEDDYVCDSLEEAIEFVLRVHGTWFKRMKWRLQKMNKCLIKSAFYQLQEFIK